MANISKIKLPSGVTYDVVDEKSGYITSASLPTKTSQLTNDSGFITTDTNTTYTLSNALSSHKFTSTLTAGGSGSGTSTATITFAAGSNVTLTDDTTNKKITIAAIDTKYSAGTGLSLSGTTFNISTVPVANGGTGKTTAADAINVLLNGLPVWTATPTDSTYFIRQDTAGTASYGKVAFSTLWTYINGKVALNYLPLTGGSVTGPVTFNDSITIDDATVGSLVVNGSASFTNNITVGGKLTVGGINVIATDISDKLTLGGAWTQLNKVVYELCGMVFYYVEAKPSSYNANYQYTMATFASGYRPSASAIGQGYTTDGNFSPKSVVSVLAQTNGALKVSASNNTGAYFFASGWFKI